MYFSPNDDGLNNLFYAFTFIGSTDPSTIDFLFEDFTFQVFNRWGQLVFETNEPTKAWDGKDGSGDVSEGVYFVVVRFKALCADSKDEVIYNGTVQLVR
jgi:gliding motility-associated-like protein